MSRLGKEKYRSGARMFFLQPTPQGPRPCTATHGGYLCVKENMCASKSICPSPSLSFPLHPLYRLSYLRISPQSLCGDTD
ncbi:hypothetical protein EZ315_08705 [Duncaniella freteri]|uniref:Uncharacterized protein n=1 Tax=Duncaniella freteri TaxID=2530391 RepID=A0A4Z0VAB2_9BACT|nr:hypothetical protein EZ315_08705 [Duncaniella freteri]